MENVCRTKKKNRQYPFDLSIDSVYVFIFYKHKFHFCFFVTGNNETDFLRFHGLFLWI